MAKKRGVELLGSFAWALLSFAVINISIQLTQNYYLPVLFSTLICSLLSMFFLSAYSGFQLTNKKVILFSLLAGVFFIAFQLLFDSIISLNNMTISGYVGIEISLIFWHICIGMILRLVSHVKK